MSLPTLDELRDLRDKLRETNNPRLIEVGNTLNHDLQALLYAKLTGKEVPPYERKRIRYNFQLAKRLWKEYEEGKSSIEHETPDITVQRGKVVIRFDDYENVISIKGKSIRVEINFEI